MKKKKTRKKKQSKIDYRLAVYPVPPRHPLHNSHLFEYWLNKTNTHSLTHLFGHIHSFICSVRRSLIPSVIRSKAHNSCDCHCIWKMANMLRSDYYGLLFMRHPTHTPMHRSVPLCFWRKTFELQLSTICAHGHFSAVHMSCDGWIYDWICFEFSRIKFARDRCQCGRIRHRSFNRINPDVILFGGIDRIVEAKMPNTNRQNENKTQNKKSKKKIIVSVLMSLWPTNFITIMCVLRTN